MAKSQVQLQRSLHTLDYLSFVFFLIIINLFYAFQVIAIIQGQIHKFRVFLNNIRPLSEFLHFGLDGIRYDFDKVVFEYFRPNYIAFFVTLSAYALATAKLWLFLFAIQAFLVLSFARVDIIKNLFMFQAIILVFIGAPTLVHPTLFLCLMYFHSMHVVYSQPQPGKFTTNSSG